MSVVLGFLVLSLAVNASPRSPERPKPTEPESAPLAGAADSLAVVAVDGCSQEAASGSARLLRAALAVEAGREVKSEEETLRMLGGPLRGSLLDAERLLESARVEFDKEFSSGGRAEKAAREAMAILMALPPSESSRWQRIRDVASFLAFMYEIDQKPEASLALEPIMRVEPGFQVDKELYSPSVWKEADKARKQVKALATATLRVTTRPAGLLVYVDGRRMGKAPVVLKLPPGEYRVEGDFGKERALARTVRVQGRTAVELDQAFDGSIRVGSGPCMVTSGTRESRLGALVKLAAYLGVKQVVGVWQEELAKGEVYLVASAVDAATGQEVREARVKVGGGQVPVGAIEKLAQFISTGTAPPPVEPVRGGVVDLSVQSSPVPVPVAGSGSSVPRPGWRVASYVSGGVAIAAFGLGAYGLLTSKARQGDLDKFTASDLLLEQNMARVDELKSEIKSHKRLGLVSIGVGAAATGAAVGMFLYSGSQPGGEKVKVGLTPTAVYLSASF